MTDILDMAYHTRRLCVKALNLTESKEDAAHALGISIRTLFRYMRVFNILRDNKTKEYYYTERIKQ